MNKCIINNNGNTISPRTIVKCLVNVLVLIGLQAFSATPSSDQNYIKSSTYLLPTVNSPVLSTIQYFDGLGSPIQSIAVGITPSGGDLVAKTEYDAAGREYKQYLPASVEGNAGQFVSASVMTSALNSTYNSDSHPYTELMLESSPQNRVLGKKGPGADWATHPTAISYTTNDNEGEYEVEFFRVTSDKQLEREDYYSSFTLYKTKTADEDGKSVIEFKDILGKVVMKLSGTDVKTCFVYNDIGQLCYVLPPAAVDELTDNRIYPDNDDILAKYAYIYKYDEQGNCIYKRLPGCDPVNMVYDKANRLILSQSGTQHATDPVKKPKEQWTVTKYDIFGRVIYVGLINRSITQTEKDGIHNNVITEGIGTENQLYDTGYTCTNYFAGDITPLIVNYYDDYNFITFLPSGKNNLSYDISKEQQGYNNAWFNSAKGLLTGMRVYRLNDLAKYESSAIYYDDRGQIVQSLSSNHLDGYDMIFNRYNFIGKLSSTLKTHGVNGAYDTYREYYTYTYDDAQRLTTTTHQLNGGSMVTLVSNTYDGLGRLSTKTLGGADATTYSYNVQSWTTGINGSRFSENLYYNANTVGLPNFTPAYNGNIAGMQWSVANDQLGYNRAYTFAYDELNRLTDANYFGFNSSAVGGTSGRYDEHFGFDKMGNFNSLTRNENGNLLNNLSFTYTGNQLKKVDNSISPYIPYGSEAFNDKQRIDTEYFYDQNGSTKWDVNTGISLIQYNLLNLPDQIQFTEGHKNIYTYDASGKKLETVNYTVHNIVNVPINTISTLPANPSDYTKLTTDYVGNVIYENGSLKEILLPDGYYQGGVYYYYLKDHLGNNRVVINSNGAVIEKSHYYPSGMRFSPESTSNSAALPYRYNGKELEAMNGLNQYDYGARRRGAGLPIWTAVDPLAEKYYSISPYVYCAGNPVNVVDPDGKQIYILGDSKKNLEFWEGVGALLKTEDGKKLWNEYASSDKNDIYIGISSFKSDKEAGGAVKNIGEFGAIKDNKIDISNFEGNKEAFSNFQGHDVSKSKGRSVSLISLDAGELKKNSKESNPYQNAETIYHEMKAHIKDGGSNDHGRYGNDQTGLDIERPGRVDYSGNWPREIPAWHAQNGTPYYRIREQLLILKRYNQRAKK